MKQRIPVGSKVRATAKYASENDDLSYINSVGELMKDDGTGTPYRVVYEDQNEFHWFRESELELAEEPVDEQSFASIKLTVLKIMSGKVFYTERGSKIHLKDGVLLFNTRPLDLRKLLNVKLSLTNPMTEPPFKIDPVKFAHCKVWDNNEANSQYDLVIKYEPSNEFPFVTKHKGRYRNAKLVWEMPTTRVAELYGVSDNAIAARCKKISNTKTS